MWSGRTNRAAARGAVAVVVALVTLGALGLPAGAATVSGPDEFELLRLHNETRAANRLAPLADDLAAREVARAWARHLADTGVLRHNPDLVEQVDQQVTRQWTRLGENVGRATDAARVYQAFLSSSAHRANIVGDYNRVGIGAARDGGGQLWVVVIFLKGPPIPVVSSATWAPFGSPYVLADQQYRDFLSRPADPGGLDHWATLLRGGTWSAAQEIEWFMGSPEFGALAAPVVRLYLAAFTRIPDQRGLQAWIDQRRAGTSLLDVARAFASSDEFVDRYGSMSNRTFVDALYRNVFGRPADRDGLDYWAGGLDSRRFTRADVLLGLAQSSEFVNLARSEVLTVMAYAGMLRRSPDPSGYQYWVGQIDAGRSVRDLVGGFLHSGEYARRF